MEKYTFYYPDGAEIGNMEEFIKFYSRMYYYVDHNFALEAKMEKLLKRMPESKLDKGDLKDILLWKTGGTLSDNKNFIITRYKEINIDDVDKAYKAWKSDCRKNSYSDEKAFVALIGQLKNHNVKGIGPVIAISLMYYDSCGGYPIYDQYADIAVQFILGKLDFPKIPDYHTLSTSVKAAYTQYQTYRDNLIKIFKDRYENTDRDIDRALWVYGHMFSDNKTNQKNEKEFGTFKEWRQSAR